MPKQKDTGAAIRKIEKNLANNAAADSPKIRKFLMAVVNGKIKDRVLIKARKDKNGKVLEAEHYMEVDVPVKERVNAAKVYGSVLLPKAVADKKQTEKNDTPLDHEAATAEVHEQIEAQKQKKAAAGGGGSAKVVEFSKAAKAKASASLFKKGGK
jgi:hypothetical protein